MPIFEIVFVVNLEDDKDALSARNYLESVMKTRGQVLKTRLHKIAPVDWARVKLEIEKDAKKHEERTISSISEIDRG